MLPLFCEQQQGQNLFLWILSLFLAYFNKLCTFFYFLCGLYGKQMASQSVILYLRVQLVEIVAHTQQKHLQFYFCFPSQQKSLELIIIFQYTKAPSTWIEQFIRYWIPFSLKMFS